MNAERLDPYVYGMSSYGLHTLPPGMNGVDCCDVASVGGWSRARSQGDLCHPGTPHWASGRTCPTGIYATTLEMRRNGSVPGQYGGFVGYPRLQHPGGSQLTLPDVWATPCPVHGATGTNGRRHPVHHIYDMPLLDNENDGAVTQAQKDGNPTSPFYHELDVQSLGIDGVPSPPPRPDGPPRLPAGDSDQNSAPFSKI